MGVENSQSDLLLGPYRVLDLTDDRGEIAAMVLGDLGADVIKVEPPGGSASRSRGPLLASGPQAERSLQFFAFNRNKRSIVLNLEDPGDMQTLLQLVATADFIFESVPDSLLSAHGVSFESLTRVNPQLVQVQISPFGTAGPAKDWPANDLTIAALGGPVALQGVIERPPVRLSVPQVWRHAGVEAAVAALIAHARMRQTGEAQLVDVSAQCAMTWTMLNAMGAAAIQGRDFERKGSEGQTAQITLPIVFATADGYVVAPPSSKMMMNILDWMIEDGIIDEAWSSRDWSTYDSRLLAGEAGEELDAYTRFCCSHTNQHLLTEGLRRGATFAPVYNVADVLDFNQLEYRGYWHDISLPDQSEVRIPGVFAKLEKTPLSIRRPPPTLDQHADEIRLEQLQDDRKRAARSKRTGELPLAGLKVADFSWVGVGPITARCLADHGATVVRVESELRPDVLRGGAPFKDGEPGWNRSQFYGDFNTSKLGMLLNLKDPSAIAIARRLISWADVYIEAFTPGTVEELGIGYEVARELNPNILMVSTCLMGQNGPASKMAGFGYHAGAMAGFYEVTGWPDLPPSGPWVAYTDTIAPRFLLSTLLAAIDYRRRTGVGQHIDAAQFEMGLHFLAPEILDYQVNGHIVSRIGNRARDMAPQGVYPCSGTDQWCAIAIESDVQWLALTKITGVAEWQDNKQLSDHAGRLNAHDQIDRLLAKWTQSRDKSELTDQLRRAGIPAGDVQRSSDLLRDQQYQHRKFYYYYDHPEMGNIPYAGHQFIIRGYQSGPRSAAPILGEHSVDVLQGLLGMTDEEVGEALASGAIQ